MEAASETASLIGSVIAERYRIQKLLGEGGMGAVYLAEHIMMRKRVALKLLHADMSGDADILARFRREAEAAARVEHPNVAGATDFGQTADGSFFLVLEYLEGRSLRREIEKGAFAPARALHVARQVALALERAHDLGVIHRDLKPDNVMLIHKGDDTDFVKVLDFGIAKLAPMEGKPGHQPLTRFGTIIGTPEYMSPEQAIGEPATTASDLYSLGIVLYEMLTGDIPFDAEDRNQILTKHVVNPPPKMAGVAPPIEALVMRLLEKDPKNRHANAAALRTAIDEAAAQAQIELVHVQPPSARALPAASPRTSEPEVTGPPRNAWNAGDSLARTEYGLATAYGGSRQPEVEDSTLASQPEISASPAPPVVATAHTQLGIPGLKLGPLDQLPRPFAIAALGAPFFVLAFVIVIVVAVASHKSSSAGDAKATPDAGVTGTIHETHASPAKLATAKAGGVPALEALAREYPDDVAIQVAIAKAAKGSAMYRAIKEIARIDGSSFDDEIADAVVAAAQPPESSEEAFVVLEDVLGYRGVDGLIELSLAPQKPTKQRAAKGLARPEVRAHATPAAAIYLDFKAATQCKDKKELLERVKTSGDTRMTPLLKPLKNKSGCGFAGIRDCWPCMRRDDDLDEASSAVEERPQKRDAIRDKRTP